MADSAICNDKYIVLLGGSRFRLSCVVTAMLLFKSAELSDVAVFLKKIGFQQNLGEYLMLRWFCYEVKSTCSTAAICKVAKIKKME